MIVSRKSLIAVPFALAALAAAPALAQEAEPAPAAVTAATPTVGAEVRDTSDGVVGTISAVDGDRVVLRTDRHEIALPAASFTAVENGFIIAMTRDEANAAADEAQAAARNAISVGATVRDTSGGTVGTIEAIDGEHATIRLSNGAVRLPLAAIAAAPTGPVIALTAAELEAQVSAAGGAGAGDSAPE